jgi:hypothetical protein
MTRGETALGGDNACLSSSFNFLTTRAISALSATIFARLSPDAGAELADRVPVPTETSDQRVG